MRWNNKMASAHASNPVSDLDIVLFQRVSLLKSCLRMFAFFGRLLKLFDKFHSQKHENHVT